MPRNTLLAFLSAAALGLFLPSGAQAALPTGNWIVSPIAAPSSSGVGYCSMKNAYDSGIALVFARDAEGSNSVALDFRQKKLITGGQYNARLTVGGLERDMIGIAATPEILIVQMGADPAFYDLLRRKSSLDITLKGKTFSFALNGTSEALAALQDCAGALATGKTFSARSIVAAKSAEQETFDTPIVQKQDRTAVIEEFRIGRQALDNSLKDEIERLRAENRKLLLEMQAAAQESTDALRADYAAREENLTRQLDTLRRENAKLEKLETQARKLAEEKEQVFTRKLSAIAREKEKLAEEKHRAENALTSALASTAPAAGNLGTEADIRPAPGNGFISRVAASLGVRSTPMEGAYLWEPSEGVFAAAKPVFLTSSGLQGAAGAYLAAAGTRCAGDFAQTVGQELNFRGHAFVEAEMACIDGVNDSAAVVLLVNAGSDAAVVSFESAATDVERIMAERDRVLSTLKTAL